MFLQRHLAYICIMLFLVFFAQIKIQAQEQQLTLQQIIDSVKLKHPFIKSNDLKLNEKNPFYTILPSTEVLFRNGYLYGLSKESEYIIRQEFGSPMLWNIQNSLNKSSLKLEFDVAVLKQMELIAEVKKYYYESICLRLKHNTLKHTIRTLQFFYETSGWATNDSNELEKLKIEQLINKWVIIADDVYHEKLYSENQLVHTAMLYNYTIPADTVLELYQIEPVANSNTRTPATLFKTILTDKESYTQLMYKYKKAESYPSLFAGYQIRNTGNKNYFSSWEIGIRVPVLWQGIKNETQKAALSLKIAEYNKSIDESEIEKQTANLLVLLNKYFVHLNHLREFSLPGAQKIENILINKMIDNETITYSDIELYLKYQEQIIDFYETINKYNQAAIELELYAY